jgi:hypothetical protein
MSHGMPPLHTFSSFSVILQRRRLQAARTLDDILAIVPRHLMSALSDLQATAASHAGRSGIVDHAGWTRIEREHGAPPLEP